MVNFTDPTLMSKYNQALNKVNELTKKIAQLQSEIATYKQQMAAAEQDQVKKDQQNAAQTQQAQPQQQNISATNTQQSSTPAPQVQESLMAISKKRLELSNKYKNLYEIKKANQLKLNSLNEDFDLWTSSLELNLLEALVTNKSGVWDDPVVEKTNKQYYASLNEQIKNAEKELAESANEFFNVKKELAQLDVEEKNLLKPEINKIHESFKLNEDDEELDDEDYEEDYSDDYVFYIEVINDDVVVAKIYKIDADSNWEVKDIIGEAEWLDDIEFKPEFDKIEIINYLAEIFGDVREITRDEYDSYLDDKTKSDKEFYEKE